MVLPAGQMYRPRDAQVLFSPNESAFVTEEFNHRISRWDYHPQFYNFALANGNVKAVTGFVGGTLYVYPKVVFSDEDSTTTATGFAHVALDGTIDSIVIRVVGAGYTTAPTIAITLGGTPTTTATAEAFIDGGQVIGIKITNPGAGYTPSPIVTFDAPNNTDPDIVKVQAEANLYAPNDTGITILIVINHGSGYVSPPTIGAAISGGSTTGTAAVVTSGVFDPPWGTNGDGTTGKAGPITDGGSTDVFLDHPCGIIFQGQTPNTNNLIIIADTRHNRLRTINLADGAFLGSTGTGGFAVGDLYYPAGLDNVRVAPNKNNILVADELNFRVIRYTPGALSPFVPTSPVLVEGPGPTSSISTTETFVRPHGVTFSTPTITTTPQFLVGDSLRGRLTQYSTATATPALLGQIGQPSAFVDASEPGNLYFPGSGHSQDNFLEKIYIANTRSNQAKSLDNTNAFTNALTNAGIKEGQLYYPDSMSQITNFTGYLLAVNTLSNRIEVFQVFGDELVFRSTFGSPVPVAP